MASSFRTESLGGHALDQSSTTFTGGVDSLIFAVSSSSGIEISIS